MYRDTVKWSNTTVTVGFSADAAHLLRGWAATHYSDASAVLMLLISIRKNVKGPLTALLVLSRIIETEGDPRIEHSKRKGIEVL